MSGQHPIAASLHLLAEVLENERQQGTDGVLLARNSEEMIRTLPRRVMELKSRPKPEPPSVERVESTVVVESQPSKPSPVVADSPAIKAAPSQERDEKWVRAQLNDIFREVKSSEEVRSLGTLFETVVFATGNPMADLMFVGEAPGAEEEKQREPFVGPAGQKLNQIIQAMGLTRDAVYISNIVKFRPKKGDGRFQGASNRKPSPDEMAACIRFIRREIEVVQPKVIVALGLTAAEGLLDAGGTLSSFRNRVHEFAGVPVVVTYHPSYLLRQERESDSGQAKSAKRAVWVDVLQAMEILGLPISDRQRNFFT